MNYIIKAPVRFDYENGTYFFIGADHELIFSSYDLTKAEAEEIRDALNTRKATP